MSYNYKKLLLEIPDETHAAKFLQKVGIIHNERSCCGMKMKPIEEKKRDKLIPLWRCISCRRRKGIRVDTWLDPSKLPLDTIVEFIYWWSCENTSMKFCEKELGMGYNSTVDWSMYMREVCANSILQRQGMIGGPGYTIEIDESLFSKRKSNAGRMLPEQWIFGGICRETREVFMVAVPNRTANVLLGVIRERIVEGSTIISDCWSAYNMIGADGTYNYLRVNHKYNFVNPDDGAHTQTIERTWRTAKWRNKKHFGTHRQMIDSYLCEFLWREDVKRRGVDAFDDILTKIVDFMPPK